MHIHPKRTNMAKNVGKIFEQDISKSVPDYAGIMRLPDAAQSFGGGSDNLRFSRKSPCDYIIWNPKSLTPYALEMKTTKEKSISFARSSEQTGAIKYHQIVGLSEIDKIGEVVCGFIIEFREEPRTIFIRISDFLKLIDLITKKSFRIKDLDIYHIPYIVIPQTLLKTHYRYDIDYFLKKTALH